MRHNKKRNTAFIYEILTKELTKAILDKNAEKKLSIMGILKEHFTRSAPLAEELNLYNVLLKTQSQHEIVCKSSPRQHSGDGLLAAPT